MSSDAPKKSFFDRMGSVLDESPALPNPADPAAPPPAAAAAPAATPPPAPAATPPAPAAATPPEPVEVRKPTPKPSAKLADPEIPPVNPPAAEPTFSELLGFEPTDDEADHLDTLRWAGKAQPEKYGKSLEKEINRLKAYHGFYEKWQADHPDDTLSDDDADFVKFRQSHPGEFKARDMRDLRDARLIARAKEETQLETRRELDEIRRGTEESRVAPQIAEQVATSKQKLLEEAIEDAELREAIAKDPKSIPIIGEIVSTISDRFEKVTEAWERVSRGIDPFDLNNEFHAFGFDVEQKASAWFKENGGTERIRDGKQFTDRMTLAKLRKADPEKAKGYWSFSVSEIQEIIQSEVTAHMKNTVNERVKELEALGAKRPWKKEPDPQPAPAGDENSPASPRATPAPGPGASSAIKPESGPSKRYSSVLDG